MKHIKKRYYVLIILSLFVFLTLFFLSTFIKNYINKNSKELTGRKIELSDLSINYLRVAVRANNMLVYENNDVDTFAGFRELYINFDPTKLLGNEYSFSSILLDSLYIHVIKDDELFNFSDLMTTSDTLAAEESDTIPGAPFRFSVHNLQLLHGNVNFYDKVVDNHLKLEDLSLELPLIAWDSESSDVGIEFELGKQGKVFVNAHVDQVAEEYNLDFKMEQIELANISNYVEEIIDAGGISGFFNADLKINGHMQNTEKVLVSGHTSIDSFRMWEHNGQDVFRLNQINVALQSIDLEQQNFHISQITLNKPVITASLYPDISNIERVFSPLIAVDSTLQEVNTNDTPPSDSSDIRFLIDEVQINNGELLFSDHTLYRTFQYDLKDINATTNNISNDASQIPLTFSINMNDQGMLKGQSTFSLVNPLNFELNAELKRLRLLSFSPYTEYHIAHPITQGDFNYQLGIKMTPTHMTNTNAIVIKELELGNKTNNKPQVKAPVKLGLYLMKDPKDMIKIDLPVEGNPSDPNFSISKLVWKAFTNLLVKAAASPFNALGNLVSTRPEELENIPLPYAQDSLAIEQRKILDKIALILEKKPQLIFSFEQQTDPEKEKTAIAIILAKKQMLKQSKSTNKNDLLLQEVGHISDTDEQFVSYLKAQVAGSDTLTTAQACKTLIHTDELDDAFRKLLLHRNKLVQYYLVSEKGVDSTNIEISTADLRNLPDELRSCNYKVEVSIK